MSVVYTANGANPSDALSTVCQTFIETPKAAGTTLRGVPDGLGPDLVEVGVMPEATAVGRRRATSGSVPQSPDDNRAELNDAFVTAALPARLRELAVERARVEERSLSSIVRRALDAYLKAA